MKILSWNVAGIRACLKRGSLQFLQEGEWDVICFQETKATKEEVEKCIPETLAKVYPYRYWHSTKAIPGFQRKGLSGTAIWSKVAPKTVISPDFDNEGRVIALEYLNWNLITVYTPNSQGLNTDRNLYRVDQWDIQFRDFINQFEKQTIVCGDFNVACEDIDVEKPIEYRNKCAGFLDNERVNFVKLLEDGWVDIFRETHPGEKNCYTYWNQRIPAKRKYNLGWRIDYFLVSKKLIPRIISSQIHPDIFGSDHCPISLSLKSLDRKLKVIK